MTIEEENKTLRKIVEQVFSHRMLCDVRACRTCGVPVIHMEQFRGRLNEARELEDKVRTLLGQGNEHWEDEE